MVFQTLSATPSRQYARRRAAYRATNNCHPTMAAAWQSTGGVLQCQAGRASAQRGVFVYRWCAMSTILGCTRCANSANAMRMVSVCVPARNSIWLSSASLRST